MADVARIIDGTAVPSAAYTTSQTPKNILNDFGRALAVVLNVTAAGTGSITVTINGVTDSGVVYPLLAGLAVSANGVYVYRVFPGATPSANAVANDLVPRFVQIVVTANNANPVTYQVDYVLGV